MERRQQIRFSVIVPVYNVQAYLCACVKSVVEQEGPADWECILVDDGSADACPAICDTLAGLCPGVRVIHRKNGGLAAARNTGIRAAGGEYLLFLDGDDRWPAGMLARLRAALDAAPGYDWYIGRYQEMDENEGRDAVPHPGPVQRFVPGPDRAEDDYAARVQRLYEAGHWAVWRFCIRRRFLLERNLLFWPEVRWAEDYPFDLLLVRECPCACYLDVELVVYRANRAGSLLNAGLEKHFVGIAAVIRRFQTLFAAPDCPWSAAEQQEVWRRTANVFWPQARGAACRDAAVRRACAPGLTACKALWRRGDENTRWDWRFFAFLLRHFGADFALWAAGRLKKSAG